MPPEISLICPCFNEEDVVLAFIKETSVVLKETLKSYEIIFINDGSHDNTMNVLLSISEKYKNIRILNLSRNFGKEAALTAGLDNSHGEVVIPIDVDLQHPPQLIKTFIEKWNEGYDVVLAKRSNRATESFLKKLTSTLFYSFHKTVSNVEIPANVGDYRLMTKKVVEALKKLPENQRFMKGLFAWIGFKTTVVEYEVAERHAGSTTFSGWKLWNFALDGITSFSTIPLRIWFYIGIFISFSGFVYGSIIILKTLLLGIDLPGYASTMSAILFLGGIQLIGIGVLGEYIGRIYMESKRRPSYIIEDEY